MTADGRMPNVSGGLTGGVEWLSGTRALPPPAIRDLVARATAADGVAALSGHVLDAVAAGSADGLLIRHAAGEAVDPDAVAEPVSGVAVAVATDPAEVVVDPMARGRGFGTFLVNAALDRQGAVWAFGDLPAAAAVAGRLGLRRGRVLLQMRRSLPLLDEPVAGDALPEGVRIRTFVPGQDEAAFLAVNARAFAWHPEQGRLDLAGLRAEMAQSWFDPAGFFLAVTEVGRVIGFHWTKVHQQDVTPGPTGNPGPIGEVYVLGVDPAAGVKRLGAPLTRVGLDHLAKLGLRSVMLYVEGDNTRAISLYERFGFRTYLTNVVYQRP
jgi:mycothiol synthase